MLLKKPKKDAKFEGEYEMVLPTEDEMKFIKFTNDECFYYLVGLEKCRKAIYQNFKSNPETDESQGYLPCLETAQSYYQCTTHGKFGEKLEEMAEEAKPFFKNFTSCLFNDFRNIHMCRKYFDDVLRFYYRSEDSPFKNIY